MQIYGIKYLRERLILKKMRTDLRYKYYNQKNNIRYFSKMLPAEYEWMSTTLGWCGKAVDSLADRLTFREFRNDNFGLSEIFQLNNPDIFYDSAILSALITSCCFVYISADEDGFPRLQVIDGSNATGIIDPITGLLTEGYAVLERDVNDNILLEAYFEPGKTTYYPVGAEPYAITNPAPMPLLIPIVYRPDAKRPFGHSRISRACMDIMQGALRTIKRSEVAAEFYSFPQRYILGLAEDSEFNGQKATMSSFLSITKDDEGDHPTVGQFNQQSMAPHIEQLKSFASLFAAETGLTLDDLGFTTGNPASADAIKAAHENLRLAGRKAQRNFGSGFLNVGYAAACLRDGEAYGRDAFYDTRCAWFPIFEADASAMSGVGDAIIKINQAFPDYLTEERLDDLLGL